MKEEDLKQALRALAAETATASAGPDVEARLRGALRAKRAGMAPWWRAAAAAVFLAALGAGLAGWLERPAAPPPEVRAVTPWYYSGGVPPAERGYLIRMEVPPEAAARFGLAAAGPVQADVIIGDDGLTRAIRFVSHTGEAR
jgi:hypothetical protein